MITDGREIEDGKELAFDICIVGSGPAGITAALTLAKTQKSICLLEAGGRDKDLDEKKRFYDGENVGLPYSLYGTRSRRFGGTSDIWAGFCALLDPFDFQKRAWVPKSGWPISYKEVFPYYKKAHRALKMRPFEYDPKEWAGRNARSLPFQSDEIMDKIWHYNDLNFAKAFGKDLEKSRHISVYLNSMLTGFNLGETSDHVVSVTVSTSPNKRFTVKAQKFILACGALENARLLLVQHEKVPGNFDNKNIGRHFMEHPHYMKCAHLMLLNKVAKSRLYRDERKLPGGNYTGRAYLQVAEKIRLQKHYPNAVFRLNGDADAAPLRGQMLNVMQRLYSGENRYQRLAWVVIMNEQYPNPASRVSLSHRTDPYGVPQIKLDWQLTQPEIEKSIESLRFLGIKVGQNELGRMRIREWFNKRDIKKKVGYGCHHMGTTKMATTPRDGVVDANCKVFGVDNLYIAGSSVFPTSGCSNPTLTLLSLTLRLCDHLM